MAIDRNDITLGAPVYAPDGDKVGTVKDVQGRCFKIDAPMAPDYWLNADCIRTSSGSGGVTLAVDPDRLPDYEVANPDTMT
jgi:hypothetical protein